MEYRILQADGRAELEAVVREMIRAGWQPLGGVCVTQQLVDASGTTPEPYSTLYDAGLVYAQAMIKP